MNIKNRQIDRIERYLKTFKEIKNIIFISHTIESAKYFYEDFKSLVDLEKYNVIFMSGSSNWKDGLMPAVTVCIMCGIWYENKDIRENDNIWSLIGETRTFPLSDIGCLVKDEELNIDIDAELLAKTICGLKKS